MKSAVNQAIAAKLEVVSDENVVLRKQLKFATTVASQLLESLDHVGATERCATGQFMHARRGSTIHWERLPGWPKEQI